MTIDQVAGLITLASALCALRLWGWDAQGESWWVRVPALIVTGLFLLGGIYLVAGGVL